MNIAHQLLWQRNAISPTKRYQSYLIGSWRYWLLRITQTILLSVISLLACQNAFSQEQQPHVHGVAELLVVLDEDRLEIELHSPAMNLLGFEHQANNAEQNAIIDDVKTRLAKAESLLQFQPSTCELIGHETDFSGVTGANNKKGNKEKHDEHHAHHEDEKQHHNDIEVHYQFQCHKTSELRLMTIKIPSVFPGVHSLNAQWIINGRQGATTLDKQHQDIPIK